MAKLEKDMNVPGFTLKDQNNNDIDIKDYLGKKVFLYFYPKANTPGCTRQACNIQDSFPDFTNSGIEVLGISADSPAKQKKFADKYNLKFSLLCDEDKSVCEAFGVFGEKKMYGNSFLGIIRSSFLIDEEGKILKCWYKISPKDTVPKLMEFLDSI